MVFELNEQEQFIFNHIRNVAQQLGYPAYAVGGYVRDKLLGRGCKDIDIVCVGDGIYMAHEVAKQFHPTPKVVVYSRFGTAMFRHNGIEIEFVGARKESYTFDSRKPYVESGSLRSDQLRRDFTINALAISLNSDTFGDLIDPFDGLKDLQEKIIQTPLEPDRTFSDDPLRMMRAIRFATQLGFTINPVTISSITKNKNRISIVSKERITAEVEKILATDKPSIGFKLLFDSGILKEFFPELVALYGVEKRNGISHKDNFYHTLEVLDNLCQTSDDIWLRWAALLHDIAKPPTKRFDPQHGWTFHGHEALGAAMVPRIFKNLRLPLDGKMRFVQKMVALHLRPISLTKENITDSAIRRLLFDAGEDIDALMLLCQADITTKNKDKLIRYLENNEMVKQKMMELEAKDFLRTWQPPITGEIIMETFGIPPSRTVGDIKTFVREAILDGHIPNNFEAAFELMLEKGNSMGLQPLQTK